jgi:3-hydroxybutyryl-CoA dehydrogenase
MGAGIAHVAALARKSVVLADVSEDLVQKGLKAIGKNLGRQVEKGKVTPQERDAALARIEATTILDRFSEADLVVEAVAENEGVKKELFRKLDAVVKSGGILASNTSSISITRLAAATKRPERFIGMHFMNPVPVMALVEIIRGIATSDETTAEVVALAQAMGKTPLACRDFPGFVSNRVLMPMLNEAFYVLYEGIATPDAVDGIMKLGMNHPMGPLTLADFIGLDTCLAILRVLHGGLGDDKYRPCPLLIQMVDAGWLGKKTGRGFYRYDGPGGEKLAS